MNKQEGIKSKQWEEMLSELKLEKCEIQKKINIRVNFLENKSEYNLPSYIRRLIFEQFSSLMDYQLVSRLIINHYETLDSEEQLKEQDHE